MPFRVAGMQRFASVSKEKFSFKGKASPKKNLTDPILEGCRAKPGSAKSSTEEETHIYIEQPQLPARLHPHGAYCRFLVLFVLQYVSFGGEAAFWNMYVAFRESWSYTKKKSF